MGKKPSWQIFNPIAYTQKTQHCVHVFMRECHWSCTGNYRIAECCERRIQFNGNIPKIPNHVRPIPRSHFDVVMGKRWCIASLVFGPASASEKYFFESKKTTVEPASNFTSTPFIFSMSVACDLFEQDTYPVKTVVMKVPRKPLWQPEIWLVLCPKSKPMQI